MCNVSRGVYDKGLDRGITLGREEGAEQSTLKSITMIMSNLNLNADQAMDILEISDEKREYYKGMLS